MFHFNKNVYNEINQELKNSDIYYSFEPNEMSFTFIIINDLKKTVDVEAKGAMYVNQVACPFARKFTLKNREKLTIVLADVLRDYLVETGQTPIIQASW